MSVGDVLTVCTGVIKVQEGAMWEDTSAKSSELVPGHGGLPPKGALMLVRPFLTQVQLELVDMEQGSPCSFSLRTTHSSQTGLPLWAAGTSGRSQVGGKQLWFKLLRFNLPLLQAHLSTPSVWPG